MAFFAPELFEKIFFEEVVLVKLCENVLGYFCLERGGCSPEVIKIAVEPFVDLLVDYIIFIT